MENEGIFEYSVWWRNGSGWMVRRSALPLNHPESVASLWKAKYGDLSEFPWEEVYGQEPTTEEFITMGIGECPTCKRPFGEQ